LCSLKSVVGTDEVNSWPKMNERQIENDDKHRLTSNTTLLKGGLSTESFGVGEDVRARQGEVGQIDRKRSGIVFFKLHDERLDSGRLNAIWEQA